MRKAALLYFGALTLLTSAFFFSCTKTASTINDSQAIATPYSLYFTDVNGALYNTNDGKTTKVIFTSNGSNSRSFVTYGNNILWIMDNLYASTNNGVNFNFSLGSPDLAMDGFRDVNGKQCGLNQSMMINVPAWNDAYVATRTVGGGNYFGMAESYSGGVYMTWHPEVLYDTVAIVAPNFGFYASSFTFLPNSTLIAYSACSQTCMHRSGSATTRWTYKPADSATTPFPPSLDTSKGWFSLGHINNRAILIDNKGTAMTNGFSAAYYSDDNGLNWSAYTGLPANTPITCIASPFEQVCLVGTDGKGVYLLNPNTNSFQPSNNGLPSNVTVRNIAFKQNVYKNGTVQQYVYLATNQGIYQSADLGADWVLTIPGNYVTIY